MTLLDDGTVRVNSSEILYGKSWSFNKSENKPCLKGLVDILKRYNEDIPLEELKKEMGNKSKVRYHINEGDSFVVEVIGSSDELSEIDPPIE